MLDTLYWVRLAALAGLLALAILRARQRCLKGEAGDQGRRILFAWLNVILGFAIYLGLFSFLFAPLAIFYVVAIVLLWVAAPAIASIVVVDVGAKLMQAERTGFWLGAGIIAFVAITFLWLGLLGLGPLLLVPGLWLEFLALASIPAAAAIIWWSWLPEAAGEHISKAFE